MRSFVSAVVCALVLGACVETFAIVVDPSPKHVDLVPPNHAPALGWVAKEMATNDDIVDVTVALRQGCSAGELEAELLAVSDPTSPKYGAFWTLEEVASLVAASDSDIDAVTAWLRSAGAVSVTVAGTRDLVTAVVPARGVEKVLLPGTRMQWFHKASGGVTRRVLRSATGKAALPGHLASVVDAIEGVYDFPGTRRTSSPTVRGAELLAASVGADGRSVDAVSGDALPVLSIAAGFDTGAVVIMSPVCKDGVVPTGVKTGQVLCADHAPAIENISLTLEQNGRSTTTTTPGTVDGTVCQCAGVPVCTCSLAQGSLLNYANATASIAVHYVDGTSSGTVTDPFSVVPSAWITANAIHKFYGIPAHATGNTAGNSQAVIEFDSQYYSKTDLEKFSQLSNYPTPDVTVVGGDNTTDPGGEATLDIQLVTSVGQGTPTYFWYSKGYLLQYLAGISSDANPPLVQSISYGTPEALSIKGNVVRANTEFMKAGLRGITVISTAGDLGVSDGVNCSTFYPDFPSSSPYTTSLGATAVARLGIADICSSTIYGQPFECAPFAEIPCALDAGAGFTTGGMFSGLFARPAWQNKAVHSYLDNTANLPTSNFNSSGRGYNDVGAFGNNILVVTNGVLGVSGGTSASGPIFAAVVGLLNSQRLAAGQKPLGFFNPLLYKIGDDDTQRSLAFNPVSGGNNQCGEQMCCPSGLPGLPAAGIADSGAYWSPLAGLGTPNYPGLLSAVLAAGETTRQYV